MLTKLTIQPVIMKYSNINTVVLVVLATEERCYLFLIKLEAHLRPSKLWGTCSETDYQNLDKGSLVKRGRIKMPNLISPLVISCQYSLCHSIRSQNIS